MICLRSQTAGFGMLGLLSFIALMAMLTAAVSISTMRSALGSSRMVERVQVQAAAEGAAVLLAAGDVTSSSTIQIGDCDISITPIAEADQATTAAVASARLESQLVVRGRARYTRAWKVTLPPAQIVMEPLS